MLNRRLPFFAAIAVFAGVFVGAAVSNNLIASIITPTAVIAVGVVLSFFLFKKKGALILAMLFALGCGAFLLDYHINGGVVNYEDAYVSARVVETDADGGTFGVSDVVINGKKTRFRAKMIGVGREVGDVITFRADVNSADISLSDASKANTFAKRTVYFKKISGIEKVGYKKTFIEKIKDRATAGLDKYMKSEDKGITESLLFGDKSSLSHDDREMFAGIGMSHVFAVSGLHVGFLTALLLFILKKCRANNALTIIITAAVLLLYAAVTGFASGVKRAAVMSVIYLIGKSCHRKNDPLCTLSAAATFIVLTNPREMFDMGFCMSFLAVLGIISFYGAFYRLLTNRVKNKAWRYVSKSFALTLSANALLLPYCLNIFNTVAVYMLFSNLIILPIVTVAYTAAMIVAVLSVIFSGFGVLYYLIKYPIIAIRVIGDFIYGLPYATVATTKIGAIAVLLILLIFFFSRFFKVRKEYKAGALGIVSAASLLIAFL